MHDGWLLFRWMWTAVVIVYCVLAVIASKRLRGGEKKLNHAMLVVIAILELARIWVRHAFGSQVGRLAGLFVGLLAGIAALVVAKMLLSQTPSDGAEEVGGDDRIQSLRLS
jgi:hypothetical protein